jgi:hypothetical protein
MMRKTREQVWRELDQLGEDEVRARLEANPGGWRSPVWCRSGWHSESGWRRRWPRRPLNWEGDQGKGSVRPSWSAGWHC